MFHAGIVCMDMGSLPETWKRKWSSKGPFFHFHEYFRECSGWLLTLGAWLLESFAMLRYASPNQLSRSVQYSKWTRESGLKSSSKTSLHVVTCCSVPMEWPEFSVSLRGILFQKYQQVVLTSHVALRSPGHILLQEGVILGPRDAWPDLARTNGTGFHQKRAGSMAHL